MASNRGKFLTAYMDSSSIVEDRYFEALAELINVLDEIRMELAEINMRQEDNNDS